MKLLEWEGGRIPAEILDTVVIGSGCAGFNAADTLYDLGCRSVAILTEGVNMGTSRNTGSDKQTYYKLSLCSDSSDSIYELAENLFHGGSVNGDTALAEAAGSVRSFMKLVNLGVPFPTNRYGEYVGYKTDHDPRKRATSCGPLTSKLMTEKLEASVRRKNIPIFDRMQAVRLLTEEGRIRGVLALDLNALEKKHHGLTLFLCRHVVLATGGPAILYGASVYPESQTGMTGMALEAGAHGCNLQEWQYGLASIKFRWNVSGTYQQVLPRYIAVDQNGNEREFLPEYFQNPARALDMVFLKGYQWPFDTEKVDGSSLIDLLVYHEIFHKGNRVFMDFRQNPSGLEEGFDSLCSEAREYLERSEALLPTPIARLAHMNPKAIQLYASHGIDLYTEPLEIAVCAQHHNGGIAVDANWQSTIEGLYVAGEAAGTFGIARPGGSALNSTQVGSQRAAEHIVFFSHTPPVAKNISPCTGKTIQKTQDEIHRLFSGGSVGVLEQRRQAQQAMSAAAAHVRSVKDMEELSQTVSHQLAGFYDDTRLATPFELSLALKNRDMLLTQQAVLSAMKFTAEHCQSRGSALVLGEQGKPVGQGLLREGSGLESTRFLPGNGAHREDWMETVWNPEGAVTHPVPVRPLPRTDDWFETVWQEYDKTHILN